MKLGYQPSADNREMHNTSSQHKRKQDNSKISKEDLDNDSKNELDCDMIVWGKWKHHYEDPILLNLETHDGEPLKGVIYSMVSFQDFLIFLTNEGKLYSMGQSDTGMLGLGVDFTNTKNKAYLIHLSDSDIEVVTDVQVGKGQVLVLTNQGQVYGWGLNNNGQVGVIGSEDEQDVGPITGRERRMNAVWTPQLVYPPIEMRKLIETEKEEFDPAKQIEVYEDSSFLLTENGKIYSWGRNDHGFLGREAKIDVKLKPSGDKRKKLAFSTFQPGKIEKLDKYPVKKIKVQEGKFYAYFIDNYQEVRDSEFDSDEEKDVMVGGEEFKQVSPQVNQIEGSSPAMSSQVLRKYSIDKNLAHQMQDFSSGLPNMTNQDLKRMETGSVNESRMKQSNTTFRNPKRYENNQKKKWDFMNKIIKEAIQIKDDLVKFEKRLADAVKPLNDIQDRDFNYLVVDKVSLKPQKISTDDDLRQVIDKMQIQFKQNYKSLEKLQSRIGELGELINQNKSKGDEFDEMGILTELLNESLTMKKFNLVGCKMKVYQERMREIKQLPDLRIQFSGVDKLVQGERAGGHRQVRRPPDHLQADLQEHPALDQGQEGLLPPAAHELLHPQQPRPLRPHQLRLPDLRHLDGVQLDQRVHVHLAVEDPGGGVHQQADQEPLGALPEAPEHRLQQEGGDEHEEAEGLQDHQGVVRRSDERHPRGDQDSHRRPQLFSIRDVVRNMMKRDSGSNEILYYCNQMVHDAALIRQLLYSAQIALFEGAQVQQTKVGFSTPGLT